MRKDFYEVFQDLYDGYRLDPFHHLFPELAEIWPPRYVERIRRVGRSRRWVREAVERAAARLQLVDRVRPDAKHFLLVNMHQMVVLPLLYGERERLDESELIADLRRDTELLLSTASEITRTEEISGHAVMDAVSRVWEKLRVGRWEIWG